MIREEARHMTSIYSSPPSSSWYDSISLPTSWKLIQGRLMGKKILDIGACSGWVSWHARKQGAHTISSDIFVVNMSSSLVRVICDKEQLPFKNGSFDFVLTANVLHHGNMNMTVSEVYRVLRYGGELVSLQEPCIRNEDNESDYLKRLCKEELDLGIDERRPSLDKYKSALSIFKNIYFYVMTEQIFSHTKQPCFKLLMVNSCECGIAIRACK